MAAFTPGRADARLKTPALLPPNPDCRTGLPEYLPFAPYGVLIGYTTLILLAIVGAYAAGGIRLGQENIIAMIKDDTL